MDNENPIIHFAYPYILICGSYQLNKTNDAFCEVLGIELARQNIAMLSGGGVSGLKVAESMDKVMSDSKVYDPTKIVTVYRKKNTVEEIKVKRTGSAIFFGESIGEMRSFIFSKVSAVVVIGGSTKTKEEVQLAQKLSLEIIPVGMTGGMAYTMWQEYFRTKKYTDHELLLRLNSKNSTIAVSAVMSILMSLTSVKESRSEKQD